MAMSKEYLLQLAQGYKEFLDHFLREQHVTVIHINTNGKDQTQVYQEALQKLQERMQGN
jgi:deoxyadenosine/deoxycytidine kinase